MPVCGESKRSQGRHGFVMGRKIQAFGLQNPEHTETQTALGCDGRIELAYGTGRNVAGICKQWFSLRGALLVETQKAVLWHIHLAAHLQKRNGLAKLQRQSVNGFQVFRHVFPDNAVAAGRAADKHAVSIFQRHGQAVDFRLQDI